MCNRIHCICIFDCIMTKTICKYAFNWFVIIIAAAVVLSLLISSGCRCGNRLDAGFIICPLIALS